MNKKKIGGIIVGILLMVAGVIIFFTDISGEEVVMKIAGTAIIVAGLTFVIDSIKRKN